VITAAATLAMAFTSYATIRLTKRISNEEQRHQQQFSDLLQALVVSNMTTMAGGFVSTGIAEFKKYYRGTTPVFKE